MPPPARLAPLAGRVPQRWQRRALEAAMAHVLGPSVAAGDLAFLEGRCLGIEATDLALRWTIGLRGGRLASVPDAPEASVRGTATDLLLLAGRAEDADTLFFQRRLVLTGDTELGLTARNLLEGLSWETVPLGLRIGLSRGARLARAARQARREGGRADGDPCQQA
jgi:predicted lipid carrier protein YhbT